MLKIVKTMEVIINTVFSNKIHPQIHELIEWEGGLHTWNPNEILLYIVETCDHRKVEKNFKLYFTSMKG